MPGQHFLSSPQQVLVRNKPSWHLDLPFVPSHGVICDSGPGKGRNVRPYLSFLEMRPPLCQTEWVLSLLVGVFSGEVASLPLEPGVAIAPGLTLPGCTCGRSLVGSITMVTGDAHLLR